MAGEAFFLPTVVWAGKDPAERPPSFLPGHEAPSWLTGGAARYKELIEATEGLLMVLYLAGYEVPEVALARDGTAGGWISFDTTTMRLSVGGTTWSDEVGGSHPASGTPTLALRAEPVGYVRRGVGALIAVDLASQPAVDVDDGGWVTVAAPELNLLTLRTNVAAQRNDGIAQLRDLLIEHQSAATMEAAPGMIGMYHGAFWSDFESDGSRTSDAIATLKAVLAAGLPVGVTSPVGDAANNFLDTDIVHPTAFERRTPWGLLKRGRRTDIRRRLGADRLRLTAETEGQLDTLAAEGIDPDWQTLTMAILDVHRRGLVDVVHGYTTEVGQEDLCIQALELVDAATLNAADVAVMCDCLEDAYVTAGTRAIVDRLAAEYPVLYDDAESRARIRDALVFLCETAPSLNAAFNDQPGLVVPYMSAESFAATLAALITTEPDSERSGFDIQQYLDPVVEVDDLWQEWNLALGRSGRKMASLTPTVFMLCGNRTVGRHAAIDVLDAYVNGVNDVLPHWTDPDPVSEDVYEFVGQGSWVAGREGWSHDLFEDLMTMLALTHPNGELETELPATLSSLRDLVGHDPLDYVRVADPGVHLVDLFEAEYRDLIEQQGTDATKEYITLLGVAAQYATASTEADAARYDSMQLAARIDELANDNAVKNQLDQLRNEALQNVHPDRLTVGQLQAAVEAFVSGNRYQLYLRCLGTDGHRRVADEYMDRARRILPDTAKIFGALELGRAVADFDSLLDPANPDAMTEAELNETWGQILDRLGFPEEALVYQGAKVIKDGVGIGHACATAQYNQRVDFARLAVAFRREVLWPTGSLNQPARVDMHTYVQLMTETSAWARSVEADLSPTIPATNTLGNLFSVGIATIVIYQLYTDGAPTSPDAALGVLEDLTVGAAAMADMGAGLVKLFAANPAAWADAMEAVATGVSRVAVMASITTFCTTCYGMFRYIDQGDTWGAIIYGAATISSAVAVAASLSIVNPVIGAIASVITMGLIFVDIARKLYEDYLRRQELEAQWRQYVAARGIMYHRTVAVETTVGGTFSRTGLYVSGDSVDEIGMVTQLQPGTDDTPFEFTVGEGISHTHATATPAGADGVSLACPLPAAASEDVDSETFSVTAGDTVLTVEPWFESWIEVDDPAFDRVLITPPAVVDVDTPIYEHNGETVTADWAGTIRIVDSGPGSQLLNARMRLVVGTP